MKTQLYFALLFLIFSAGRKGETTEHQKMMDDIEKKGLKAQKRQLTAPELLLIGGRGKNHGFTFIPR